MDGNVDDLCDIRTEAEIIDEFIANEANKDENTSDLVSKEELLEVENDILSKRQILDTDTSIDDDTQTYTIPDDISKTIDDGPAQPRLESYPKTSFGATKSRSFCANWYNRFPWLEYSVSYDRVYCFACRHFKTTKGPENCQTPGRKFPLRKSATIYATTGFSRWTKAHERMQRHHSSARHLESMGPWLQDTLRREKKGEYTTNGTALLASGNSLVVRSAIHSPSIKINNNSLPSKRKRSRPTKKLAEDILLSDDNVTPSWCTCANCQDMADSYECVCCCDVPEIRTKLNVINPDLTCITDHPGFAPVCLNPWVLQVAYYHHKQNHGETTMTERFERYRYIAYCQFVRWCWGYLNDDMHVPLPSCVVNCIKIAFDSESDHPSLDDLPLNYEPVMAE